MQTQICTIASIDPIPEKDRIKLVKLNENAYEFIVNIEKDPFKVGDKVLMILSDSLIPENERTKLFSSFDFLKEKYFNKPLNRIKTKVVKMVGIYSIGLLENTSCIKKSFKVGDCLDDYFGITKFEENELEVTPSKSKTLLGRLKTWIYIHFPKFARWYFSLPIWKKKQRQSEEFPIHRTHKTDEETYQSICNRLKGFEDETILLTMKIEGSSMTCMRSDDKKELWVCSRNLMFRVTKGNKLNPNAANYIYAAEKYNVQEFLDEVFEKEGRELIIKGELIGPNIQKNIYKLTDYKWLIFKIEDQTNKVDLNILQIQELISKYPKYGFETVPYLGKCKLKDFVTPETAEDRVRWFENHNYFTPFDGLNGPNFYYGEEVQRYDKKKNQALNEGIVASFENHIQSNYQSFKLKSKEYAANFK